MSSSKKKFYQFIVVDANLCTGCETCESVCSFTHDGVFNPINTRIHRIRIEPILNVALACQKCDEAPCIKSCPEHALDKDPDDGSIVVDEDKCNGCGFCVRACDFGVMSLHLDTMKALTCDLCEGMKEDFIDPEVGKKEPQCIAVCPKEAIALKNVVQIGEGTRIEAAKKLFADLLVDTQ